MTADVTTTLASWSTTAGSNQPDNSDAVGPSTLAENLRTIQAVTRQLAASGTIASASSTDLSTVSETYVTVTGTTTITSFGTVSAGIYKWLIFSGALTLTHNATSLILPTDANITTAAGDTCLVLSLGSGNWRCLAYLRKDGGLVGSLSLADGTAGTPGVKFSSDTNTGIYRSAADTLNISTGGTSRVEVGNSAVTVTPATTFSSTTSATQVTATSKFLAASGTAIAPTYTFTSDSDTGLYSAGANTLGFATNGAVRMTLDTTKLEAPNGSSASDDEYGVRLSESTSNGGLCLHNTATTLTTAYSSYIAMSLSGALSGRAFICHATGTLARAASTTSSNTTFSAATGSAGATTYDLIAARTSETGSPDTEFKVRGDGTVYSDGGTAMTTPADYAEMFEWADGNPSAEDRVGYSVSLVGNQIKVAEAGETPIGIVSGNPAVLGDAGALRWVDKYLRDEFNRPVLAEDGTRVLNPVFDPETPYTPRIERKEWAAIGLMGKLRLRNGQITAPGWIKMRDISADVSEWLVR